MKQIVAIVIFIIVLSSACINDDTWYEMNQLDLRYDTLLINDISKQNGVFIVNEGNFMYDNASLSYYLIDSMKVLNEVFYLGNKSFCIIVACVLIKIFLKLW